MQQRGVWQHTHTEKVDWTSREQTYRRSRGVWQHTYRENRLRDAAEVLGSRHTESRLDIQREQTYRCSRGVGQQHTQKVDTQKVDCTYRENRLTDAAEVFGSTHTERTDLQMQQRCWAAHIQREQTYRCSRGVGQHTYRENRPTDAAEVLGSTHTERADLQMQQRCWAAHTHTQKVDWTYRQNRLTDAAEVFGSTHTEKADWTYKEQTYRCSKEVFGSTHVLYYRICQGLPGFVVPSKWWNHLHTEIQSSHPF